jgi:hypothetical protein
MHQKDRLVEKLNKTGREKEQMRLGDQGPKWKTILSIADCHVSGTLTQQEYILKHNKIEEKSRETYRQTSLLRFVVGTV